MKPRRLVTREVFDEAGPAPMHAPGDLGLAEAAAAIRDGRLSAETLTRACLERIRAGEPQIGAWAWCDAEAALERRTGLIHALRAVLEGMDAIVTPPATGEAPPTLGHTGSPVFCTIWSLAGVPALTLPVGLGPRGLPLGLQLVGRHGDDAALVAAARCEQATGWREERGHDG